MTPPSVANALDFDYLPPLGVGGTSGPSPTYSSGGSPGLAILTSHDERTGVRAVATYTLDDDDDDDDDDTLGRYRLENYVVPGEEGKVTTVEVKVWGGGEGEGAELTEEVEGPKKAPKPPPPRCLRRSPRAEEAASPAASPAAPSSPGGGKFCPWESGGAAEPPSKAWWAAREGGTVGGTGGAVSMGVEGVEGG